MTSHLDPAYMVLVRWLLTKLSYSSIAIIGNYNCSKRLRRLLEYTPHASIRFSLPVEANRPHIYQKAYYKLKYINNLISYNFIPKV